MGFGWVVLCGFWLDKFVHVGFWWVLDGFRMS